MGHRNKIGIGKFVWNETNDNSLMVADNIINTIKWYTKMMDGSTPSTEEIREIHKLCALNPKMMDLICEAFREKGYDSF